MTGTQINRSDVTSSSLLVKNEPDDLNLAAPFPKAPQLFYRELGGEGEPAENEPEAQIDAIAPPLTPQSFGQGRGGEGEDAENAPDEANEATELPVASELFQRGLAIVSEAVAGANAEQRGDVASQPLDSVPSPPEPLTSSRPSAGRRWWVAGLVLAVAAVFTIGANTAVHDAADRGLALAAMPVAQVMPADHPLVAADENEESPPNWSDRAAQLQFVTPALASPGDAAPILTPVMDTTSLAQVNAATPTPTPASAPLSADNATRGLSDKEIRFGIVGPFGGASRELGRQMKMGVETAFDQINEAGGVNGRQLKIFAADDGYEPSRTVDAMQQIYDKDEAFGFIGNVGTPTAAVALPWALDRRLLFFGAFTGASILRRDPPDRYVFNYRASYAEETDAVVRYLVKVRRIQPREIMVFAQQDAYGDSGYAGVAKAVRALPGENPDIVRVGYKRNTVDVQDAVTQLRAYKGQIKAVVMIASYRAAAKSIEKTRDLYPSLIYTNVSFVGSTALADELMLLGPRYATGAIVTQVVPAVSSYASIILKYKAALAKYFPGEAADYVSLEGYIDATILAEAIRRVGRQIDTEKLVDELERMRDLDLGLGALLAFSPNDHQGSHKVWGTQLDENGHYQAIDLQ